MAAIWAEQLLYATHSLSSYKIQLMTSKAQQYKSILPALTRSLSHQSLAGLSGQLSRCSASQLSRLQPLLLALPRKYILSPQFKNSQEDVEKVCQFLAILREHYTKTRKESPKMKYFFRHLFTRQPWLEAKLKQEVRRLGLKEPGSPTSKPTRAYKEKSPNEGNGAKLLEMLMEDELVLQTFDCLGCIKLFYQGRPYNLDGYGQNYLIYCGNIFQKQEQMTENICALLNSGGGFIFLIDDCPQDATTMEGFALGPQDRVRYSSFFDKCIRYIEPMASRESLTVDFVPVVADPLGKPTQAETTWAVRVSVRPASSRILYYISYKLLNSQKKLEVQFFKYQPHQVVMEMEFDEVYQRIHGCHRGNKQSGYESRHQGMRCYQPYCPTQNLGKSDRQDESPEEKGQGARFRYSLLVIKPKEAKNDQKKMEEIEKQIIRQKILCRVESLEINRPKMRAWLVSYDCLSDIIESIIKQFNRNGELSLARTRRCIRIQDQTFLSQAKHEELLGELRGLVGKGESVEYQMYNGQDLKLNYASKKPVFMKFRNPRHAVLAYSLVYSNNRRIQFIETKH